MDAYSLCPGGTGKKIKFCCPDLLGDLDKIERMIQGEQYVAGLHYVEQVLEKPGCSDRACLLALRGDLLRALEKHDEAAANARRFIEKHPDNPVALAEATIAEAQGNGDAQTIMRRLQETVARSARQMPFRVYEAIVAACDAMLRRGEFMAARALTELRMAVAEDDPIPEVMVMEFCRSPYMPLLLKGPPLPPLSPPSDAPWLDRFAAAIEPLGLGRWQESVDRLATLAEDVPDSPLIWRMLADVRSWLADRAGSIEALRRYAALDVPADDAVEAEARAIMLTDEVLGDQRDLVRLTYTVRDAERLHETLLSDPRLVAVRLDPSAWAGQDQPPPKWGGVLLSCPTQESSDDLTLDTASRVLGHVALFGKQTDREAQLEVFPILCDDQPAVASLLTAIGGDLLAPDPEVTRIDDASATEQMLQLRFRLPKHSTPERVERLLDEAIRRAMLEKWPETKLGALDGRTPSEAAAEPRCRNRLLGAILVLETSRLEGRASRFDMNLLRAKLGLPRAEPIEPDGINVEELTLSRLPRLAVERLSDEQLRAAYRRATLYRMTAASRKLAQAILDRPAELFPEDRMRAYATLAETAEDLDQAVRCVEEGRRAGLAAGHSCAAWDLMELRFRVARHEGREAMRLIQHIEQRHLGEPGVGEALQSFLVEIGLLHPDGTPAYGPARPASHAEPAPEAPAPGKLWTPDSAQGGSPGGLILPD